MSHRPIWDKKPTLDKIITMRCTEKQKAVFNAKEVRAHLDSLENKDVVIKQEGTKLFKKVKP